MDFFEEIIDKAKVALEVAVKTTEDVVDTGKQKFNIAALENQITKDYKALGEIFYTFKTTGEIDNDAVDSLIASINDKKEEILALREEMRKSKADRVCAACGAVIDNDIVFCPICGQKLEFTTEEE